MLRVAIRLANFQNLTNTSLSKDTSMVTFSSRSDQFSRDLSQNGENVLSRIAEEFSIKVLGSGFRCGRLPKLNKWNDKWNKRCISDKIVTNIRSIVLCEVDTRQTNSKQTNKRRVVTSLAEVINGVANVQKPPHELFSVPVLLGSYPTSLNTQPWVYVRPFEHFQGYVLSGVCLFVCLSVHAFFRHVHHETVDEQLFLHEINFVCFAQRLADEHL